MRGRLPWERLERRGGGASAVLEAKRKAHVSELSRGLPSEAAVALAAVWEHSEWARRKGAELDHSLCIEALHRGALALDTLAEVEDDAHDYDWGTLGLSWTEGGDIRDAEGAVLHSVGVD